MFTYCTVRVILKSKSDHLIPQHKASKRFPSFKVKAKYVRSIRKSLHALPHDLSHAPRPLPHPSAATLTPAVV